MTCQRCGAPFPPGTNGNRRYCDACLRQNKADWRKANKDRLAEAARRRYHEERIQTAGAKLEYMGVTFTVDDSCWTPTFCGRSWNDIIGASGRGHPVGRKKCGIKPLSELTEDEKNTVEFAKTQ